MVHQEAHGARVRSKRGRAHVALQASGEGLGAGRRKAKQGEAAKGKDEALKAKEAKALAALQDAQDALQNAQDEAVILRLRNTFETRARSRSI